MKYFKPYLISAMTIKRKSGLLLLLTFFLFSYTSTVKDHTSNHTSHDADSLGYLITSASNQQEAMNAGMKIFKQGGTAMDAALSMALAQNTLWGGRAVSFAGTMNLLYFEAATGKVHNMNASWNTVKNEMSPMTIAQKNYGDQPDTTMTNGRTVLVHGFMKGVEAAHKKFGKMPFEKLFEQAIYLAEHGVKWTDWDSTCFSASKNILSRYPETKAIFTKQDGSYYRAGDTIKQPVLAQTLKAVAREGADYMYTGKWAEKFVKTVREAGGEMTMEDLANYEVIWAEPVYGTYHGYDIYGPGYPSEGGGKLIEALNLAEVSRLSEKGHYTKSAEALLTLYQIAIGSNFRTYSSKDLLNAALRKDSANKRWETIQANFKQLKEFKKENEYKNNHSASIVAIDKWGNMVAMLHTINTKYWGSNGLFVDGVSISDPASFQQKAIANAGPGNRLPDPIIPGFVFKDGKLLMGFSCTGSGILNQTFASLLNVLDFKMSSQEATTTSIFGWFSDWDKWPYPALQIMPNKIPKSVINKAKKAGVNFKESWSAIGEYWSAIERDPITGKLQGTGIWLEVPEATLDTYVGTYKFWRTDNIVITREGNHLLAKATWENYRNEIYPGSSKEFFVPGRPSDTRFIFNVNIDGVVESLTYYFKKGKRYKGKKSNDAL
jgi:gamma-glutamyltranspeptidase / glutathione hydrolase